MKDLAFLADLLGAVVDLSSFRNSVIVCHELTRQ